MAQGLIAGATNYADQSISDIAQDIRNWISYSEEIKMFFNETIEYLRENHYWEEKVPANFRAFCYDIPRICTTFCEDFKIILTAIENDRITKREVGLMQNIYKVSVENEDYCWKSYKGRDDGYWHDYGNPLFKKVERLYGDGRDYLVALRDTSNVVGRMEDYMKDEKIVVDNSTHTDNSITIGDGNKIKHSVVGNKNSVQAASDDGNAFWKKFGLPLIIAILGGVGATALCIWLNLN